MDERFRDFLKFSEPLSRPSRVNQRIQGDSVVDGRATWLEYTREM